MDKAVSEKFLKPSQVERLFNRIFGALVGLGIGLRHNYLLQVRGRKTGRLYSAPVDVLDIHGTLFLVCGRGRAQWVRNAQVSGRVALKRGSWRREFTIRAVPNDHKPELLKKYLDRFKLTVQRYFPVPAGSSAEAFTPLADRYPVFELIPVDAKNGK
jgi:deazaflavin-dependent oxidoreductase (nitroreductase family)